MGTIPGIGTVEPYRGRSSAVGDAVVGRGVVLALVTSARKASFAVISLIVVLLAIWSRETLIRDADKLQRLLGGVL